MEKTDKYTYHEFDLNEQGYIERKHLNSYSPNTKMLFPISDDKKILEENMSIVKEMVDKNIIGKCDLSFDITGNTYATIDYEQWNVLIDFALKNNINFRVNIREEYNAREMKNYIESFSKEVDGKKQFMFTRENISFEDNPILETTHQTENIFKVDDTKVCFFVTNEYRKYFPNDAKKSIEESLKKLQTDYIDLILIHQPFNDYYGTYRAMEEAYKAGKVRARGVSNFYPDRLVDLCHFVEIKPMKGLFDDED